MRNESRFRFPDGLPASPPRWVVSHCWFKGEGHNSSDVHVLYRVSQFATGLPRWCPANRLIKEVFMSEAKVMLTREELYEKVWTTPMQKLAVEFGLSDRGLAKLCGRHQVPVPPRGYWARL
jgi:hypothetical protein